MFRRDDEQDRRTTQRRPARPPAPAFSVRRTRLGKGLFANRHFRCDQTIGEITGEIIADWDYSSRYCFDLGDIHCLEPEPPFRFVNHCCEPNCYFEAFDLSASGQTTIARRLFLIARQPIKPGEEFTIDYAWPPGLAIPCRCAAPNCRGWIVDEAERHHLDPAAKPAAPDNFRRSTSDRCDPRLSRR